MSKTGSERKATTDVDLQAEPRHQGQQDEGPTSGSRRRRSSRTEESQPPFKGAERRGWEMWGHRQDPGTGRRQGRNPLKDERQGWETWGHRQDPGQEPVPPAPEPTTPTVLRAGPLDHSTWAPTASCYMPRVSIPRNAAPESTLLRNSAGASGKEAGPHPGGGCPGRARGGSLAPSRPRRAVAEGLLRVNVLVSNPPHRPHARHSLQPSREPRPRGLPTWRLQSPKGP